MDNKKIFSTNLQSFVERCQKPRSLIANEIGVSYSTFTDWLNGNTYPSIDKIEIIANYFSIKKYELIEKRDNEYASALGKLLATDDEYLKSLVIGLSNLSLQDKAIISKTLEIIAYILK